MWYQATKDSPKLKNFYYMHDCIITACEIGLQCTLIHIIHFGYIQVQISNMQVTSCYIMLMTHSDKLGWVDRIQVYIGKHKSNQSCLSFLSFTFKVMRARGCRRAGRVASWICTDLWDTTLQNIYLTTKHKVIENDSLKYVTILWLCSHL